MAKSMYVESSDLSPVIEWFNTRPEGYCQVWVGLVKPDSHILMDIIGTDYDLATWMLDKLATGEMFFKLTIGRANLPKGFIYYDKAWLLAIRRE